MKRVAWIIGAVLAIALLYFAYTGLQARHAPAGQPALSDLNIQSFQDTFNASANQLRILVMLSPT
jgi:hypothetical protein